MSDPTREEMVSLIARAIDDIIFKPNDVISLDVPREAIDAAEVVWSKIENRLVKKDLSKKARKTLDAAHKNAIARTNEIFTGGTGREENSSSDRRWKAY